jgi:pSer/pThr/pTyr-binding forkhead associated (FHA) protein/outer membrane biosynthesis protein TonB
LKKPVVLRIYKGDLLVGVHQFLDQQIIIGSQDEAKVVLEGSTIAPIHASIDERDGAYYVSDLGSMSGTYQNGKRVLESKIESGDKIQVGEYRLEFSIGAPGPSSTPKSVSEVAPKPAPFDFSLPKANSEDSKPTVAGLKKPEAGPLASPAQVVPPMPNSAVATSMATPIAIPLATSISKPAKSMVPNIPHKTHQTHKAHKKGRKTFAPGSTYSDIHQIVKAGKGSIVEVLVAWKERVITTYHFSGAQTVSMGVQPGCDVMLPIAGVLARKSVLLKIESRVTVFLPSDLKGELTRGQGLVSLPELMQQNRLNRQPAGYGLLLDQGEMVRIDVGGELSLMVRYVGDTPKTIAAPLFDLSTSEMAGVVIALALVTMLSVFMHLYKPPKLLPKDSFNDDPMRVAKLVIEMPKPLPVPPAPVEPVPTPVEAPKPPPPPPPPKKVTPTEVKVQEKSVAQKKQSTPGATSNGDPGKSANAAPNQNKTGPKQLTSPKQGGSVKTAQVEGSQMQSPKKDISKSGLFSTFGGGGAQDRMDTASSGSGALAGLAGAATGTAGYSENRPGNGLGSKIKDTGIGGSGKALEGISGGLGTVGRGSGNAAYGTGNLGGRAGVKIEVGGAEATFSGSIDREAIRRVIQANNRMIRTCYERQLNRSPDLFGKLVLSWVIGPHGVVLSAKVRSDGLGNSEVSDCILSRLKTWRFPEPPNNQEVEVDYPFMFSNSN